MLRARLLRTLIASVLAISLFCRCAAGEDRFPGLEWDHVPALPAGWSEAGLMQAREWSQQIHSTALMVIHHGLVVAEWGDTQKRTELASVRKSFLSALIGIAVAGAGNLAG